MPRLLKTRLRARATLAVTCLLVLATCAPTALPDRTSLASETRPEHAPLDREGAGLIASDEAVPRLPSADLFADDRGDVGIVEGDVLTPGGGVAPAGSSTALGETRTGRGVPDLPETAALPPVTAQRPKIRLHGPGAAGTDPVARTMEIDGVAFATAIEVGTLDVQRTHDVLRISVAKVDPTAFRHLTPQVTADAVEVWRRVLEGDAALTHDIGNRLDVQLGERVDTAAGPDTLRVGAYASNGAPPVADAIVGPETAELLGIAGTPSVLVALTDGADVTAVAAALASHTGMEAEVLAEPEQRRAFITGADARDAFEPFTYISLGDGMIEIDPGWVDRNIVAADVPIFTGRVVCHRLLIPQLRGALQEVEDRGLADLIDPTQYGGCWVPRHILFNPHRALSMHAWGLAVDFNVRGNEYGNRNPEMDPRIVEIFERWGFVWGGRWSTPDGMHFELGALLSD